MTQDSAQRTAWTAPNLVVLTRGGAAESVLAGCKNTSGLDKGSGASVNGCATYHYKNNGHSCDPGTCSIAAAS